MNRKPKIYLAGKITKDFWRNIILGDVRYIDRYRKTPGISQMYPEPIQFYDNEEEFDKFIITGPHSISCDHHCFHDTSHAAGTDFHGDCGWEDGGMSKQWIVDSCLHQIDKSDFVFAYINHDDLYGTIAEIGYAFANYKPVFIIYKNEELKRKHWFIGTMCDYDSMVSDKPEDMIQFFNQSLLNYKKYMMD